MCDYSRKPVKWQVGNFSFIICKVNINDIKFLSIS